MKERRGEASQARGPGHVVVVGRRATSPRPGPGNRQLESYLGGASGSEVGPGPHETVWVSAKVDAPPYTQHFGVSGAGMRPRVALKAVVDDSILPTRALPHGPVEGAPSE